MANLYFYCDPDTHEISSVTTDPLSEDNRGNRVELTIADTHDAAFDPDRALKWKMNAGHDDLELTGNEYSDLWLDPQPADEAEKVTRLAQALHDGHTGGPIP